MARDEHRQEILNRLPKGGVGAEIGVWEGGFSEKLLEIAQPRILHLIDPWEYQPDYANTAFGKPRNEARMDDKYLVVQEKFKNDDRVILHRSYSHEALEQFGDGTLDWVYIDGNHNFDVVSRDLELSLAKVRPGGVIAGDDLLWKREDGAPVQKAVRGLKRQLGDAATYTRFGQQYLFQLAA
ncbi:MAG: class I SAM-dependent methyltransferase [Rhodobacter sp.]|nr:class I SAM-dependent methyltransferase [Rhodobacter sp.]